MLFRSGTITPKAQFHVGPPAGANIPNNWTALVNGRFGFVLGDKSTYFVQQGGWGELSTFDYGTAAGMPLALNMNGGNVGIATTAPGAKLDVNGDIRATGFTLTGNGASAGKVLTSDANGVASWQTPAGGATLGANTFTATQTISSGNLALPATADQFNGVLTIAGNRFMHRFGSLSTFLGENAGNFVSTGFGNSGFGAFALGSNTSGNNNTASGNSALQSNTTGFANTANGKNALQLNTIGSSNTASGASALALNTSGEKDRKSTRLNSSH